MRRLVNALDSVPEPGPDYVRPLLKRSTEIRNKLYYGSGRFRASAEGEALVNELGAVLAALAIAIEGQHIEFALDDWVFSKERCVTCPGCAFTFAAIHFDVDGGYSCPVCGALVAQV